MREALTHINLPSRVAWQGRAGAIDGHCEWLLRDVRVPVANRLRIEGAGFALAVAPKGLI